MKPGDFIQTAERLLTPPCAEADQRSAISRSYYGAFHASRRCLPPQFTPTTAQIKSGRSHQIVIDALLEWGASRASGCSNAAEASRGLLWLKKARHHADYNIEASVRHKDVENCIAESRKVIELVQHARKRFDQARRQAEQTDTTMKEPL
jgi:uncharacterized protein (UPF0332 family)